MSQVEKGQIMTVETQFDVARHVAECLQFAVLLEVSAYPKPGNVHRTADFEETMYEHFLASAVALAPCFRDAAQNGVFVGQGKISPDELGMGKLIKETVGHVKSWQRGGNTVLGTIILLMPMASAAGITLTKEPFSVSRLRKHIMRVVESTTPIDAINVYNAISIAKPGGLGKAPKLDVTDMTSRQKILEDNVSLFDVFRISTSWDSISSEWVTNYSITFDLGYPYFLGMLEETSDVNIATVHTFLKILSEIPDTLIARKSGSAKAQEISNRAKQILEAGALTTRKGKEQLLQFDDRLRDAKHRLNPGTTADLTVAVLAVAALNGYRP